MERELYDIRSTSSIYISIRRSTVDIYGNSIYLFFAIVTEKENRSGNLELYTRCTKQYSRKIRRKDRFFLNLSRRDTVQLYSRQSKEIKKRKVKRNRDEGE